MGGDFETMAHLPHLGSLECRADESGRWNISVPSPRKFLSVTVTRLLKDLHASQRPMVIYLLADSLPFTCQPNVKSPAIDIGHTLVVQVENRPLLLFVTPSGRGENRWTLRGSSQTSQKRYRLCSVSPQMLNRFQDSSLRIGKSLTTDFGKRK